MALGKALNIYIDYLMFYQNKQHFKYRFTFNNDFIMKRELNLFKFNVFSVIRNDFGHALICWWLALFVRVS